jgi:hypothetical protein
VRIITFTGTIRHDIEKESEVELEARESAERANLEKDIIYMLRFLSVSGLIRVLHFVRRLC